MGVREDEPPEADGEGEPEPQFPFPIGPPNGGRHRDPAPIAHGFDRRGTTTARHRGRHTNRRG